MKPEEFQKIVSESGEALAKRFEESLTKIVTEKLGKVEERLEKLEKATPALDGRTIVTRAVSKEGDNADEKLEKGDGRVIDLKKRENNEDDARELAKRAHATPIRVF